jgi:hypothetical protein
MSPIPGTEQTPPAGAADAAGVWAAVSTAWVSGLVRVDGVA